MSKTIVITGSTDGIGLETAKVLAREGHKLILHGRSDAKLDAALREVGHDAIGYVADFSSQRAVAEFANRLIGAQNEIDVLINNAGVLKTPETRTLDGLDIRFAVNTFAPFLLSDRLLPHLRETGRIVNIASAAQAPVDMKLLLGERKLDDDLQVYAQSKLALIMWTNYWVREGKGAGRVLVSVNPGSLLATKMVRGGFGQAGNDIGIGVDILCRAALSDEFAEASGKYYDNDNGRFASPQADALDAQKCKNIAMAIEGKLSQILN